MPFDYSTALTAEVNQGREGQPRMLQALLSNQVSLYNKLEALQKGSYHKQSARVRLGNICSSVAFIVFHVLLIFSYIFRDMFLGVKKTYGL